MHPFRTRKGRQLMAPEGRNSAKTPWSDDELRQSVDVYVLLLRLQLRGNEGRSEPVAQALLDGTLTLRNEAAIRYRMRNISAVVQELEGPVLKGFSPAESVGKQVRTRIRAMLIANSDFAPLLAAAPNPRKDDRGDARKALANLRKQIEDLEAEIAWRGHNGPPETDELGADRADFDQALNDISLIEAELEKPEPGKTVVDAASARLLGLAMKLATRIGDRATKFIDAALVAAAPVAVAKVTGLLPTIVHAVEAIGRAVGQ